MFVVKAKCVVFDGLAWMKRISAYFTVVVMNDTAASTFDMGNSANRKLIFLYLKNKNFNLCQSPYICYKKKHKKISIYVNAY